MPLFDVAVPKLRVGRFGSNFQRSVLSSQPFHDGILEVMIVQIVVVLQYLVMIAVPDLHVGRVGNSD